MLHCKIDLINSNITRKNMEKISEIKIEKVISGGNGIGRLDGKTVMVPLTAVGDTVTINIKKEKKNYIIAEIANVVEPSPDRIEPECEYFGECGGCAFWHVPYETELEYKRQWCLETINKIGKLELNSVDVVAQKESTHYRNRVQFKVRKVGGEIMLGFYRRRSKFIINIDSCMIVKKRINDQIPALKAMLGELKFGDQVPQVEVTVDDNNKGVVIVVHVTKRSPQKVKRALKEVFPKHFGEDVALFMQLGRKSSISSVCKGARTSYSIPSPNLRSEITIELSPGSFLQVNYEQNIFLIDKVMKYLELTRRDSVIDLFCGSGNFSLPISFFCHDVTGVESYPLAIMDATNNKKRHAMKNIEFICSDVNSEMKRLAESHVEYDHAIIDPPRDGAMETLKDINRIINDKIIYISCDIATFSRDAAYLKDIGFELADICLVDMFPRTYHVETIAKFSKK